MERVESNFVPNETMKDRIAIIFAQESMQKYVLQMHSDGSIPCKGKSLDLLIKAGLVTVVKLGRGMRYVLDPRHPAAAELNDLLAEISGAQRYNLALPEDLPPRQVQPERALGHQSKVVFRILLQVFTSDVPIDRATIRNRIVDVFPITIQDAIKCMLKDGLLDQKSDGSLVLGGGLPKTFAAFVKKIAEVYVSTDERLAVQSEHVGPRATAFQPNQDGAPRLFASDIRLRNFMALAIHGPMHIRDLRTITGVPFLKTESRDFAQFGRGGVVRTWQTEEGAAVMLDPDYPLHEQLLALLVKIHKSYPLQEFTRRFAVPETPQRWTWQGDRHALFGGPIPTRILTSIGVHGWTFEALCDRICTGNDRWNVKKAMQRLEKEGVIEGDRPRSPGFNTRVVTIANGFCAKDEIQALIAAYVKTWPGIVGEVQSAFNGLAPRGKAHLKKRGLWPYDNGSNNIGNLNTTRSPRSRAKIAEDPAMILIHRNQCIAEYAQLSVTLGYQPTSGYLIDNGHFNLYSRIRTYFGSFVEFRRVANAPSMSLGAG